MWSMKYGVLKARKYQKKYVRREEKKLPNKVIFSVLPIQQKKKKKNTAE